MHDRMLVAKKLGPVIQAARKDKRLTRPQLAKELGVTINYLQKIERGRAPPGVELLAKLVVRLDMKLGDVLNIPEWNVEPLANDRPDVEALLKRIKNAPSGTRRLVDVLVREIERIDLP